MRHNIRKSNQSIMWGIMAMAVIVVLVVGLFVFWCLPQK